MNLVKAREVLGADEKSSEKEVRMIYRRLAKNNHPDLSGNTEKMKEINLAYETVMKKQFNVLDMWKEYDDWWERQFGNDSIWGPPKTETKKPRPKRITEKKDYLESCKSSFWRNVFREELNYLLRELGDAREVLSVGCGPGTLEKGLTEHLFKVTGLDVSRETIKKAPCSIRKVVGSAEEMTFCSARFDAVIFVASLQFITDYKKALRETARVLKPKGKIVLMLLNPDSRFFKEKMSLKDSYVKKIKHIDNKAIEEAAKKNFKIQTEYFLGIKGKNIFESKNKKDAGLYIIKGTKN